MSSPRLLPPEAAELVGGGALCWRRGRIAEFELVWTQEGSWYPAAHGCGDGFTGDTQARFPQQREDTGSPTGLS